MPLLIFVLLACSGALFMVYVLVATSRDGRRPKRRPETCVLVRRSLPNVKTMPTGRQRRKAAVASTWERRA